MTNGASTRREAMLVNEIMKKPPATCTTSDSVTDAAKVMQQHKCGFVPVVDGRGAVVGVVTDRDVCLVVGDKNRAMTHISVLDAMSHPVFSCYGDENVKVSLGTMARRHVRRLPVLDKQGHLIGVLSIDDVIQTPYRMGAPTAEEVVTALRGANAPRPIETASA
jgi:CBS domain-containing protein